MEQHPRSAKLKRAASELDVSKSISINFKDEDAPDTDAKKVSDSVGSAEEQPITLSSPQSAQPMAETGERAEAGRATDNSALEFSDLLELPADDAELLNAYSIELVEDDDDDDDAANIQTSSATNGADKSIAASSSQDVDASKGADAAAGPLIAELVATRSELRRLETELEKAGLAHDEARTHAARRQADFDNYRKRVERDRGETYQQIVTDVVGRLLPVVDNMHRALEAERTLQADESNEFRHFLQGIELIYKQLNGVLEKYGVEVIQTIGEAFDPHVHEAVASVQSDEHKADTVVEELARGYRIGERLLRPAMVKVATR